MNSAYVYDPTYVVDETGNSVRPDMGPTTMIEGSANYLSNYTLRKLIHDDSYSASPEFQSTLRDHMTGVMQRIQDLRPNCPDFDLKQLNYGNVCDPYSFGEWGIAYLLHRVNNQDAYQDILFPLINAEGYYAAFEQTFGLSFEEFNTEYKAFLDLPLNEQLAILPDL